MGMVTVSKNVKKVLTISGVVLLGYFLITQPAAAAGMVQSGVNGLQNAADALVTFVQQLFG
jgi:hypothetical protein